jgi:hypothetical protein
MAEPMQHVPADGFRPQLNDILGQLFRAHGVECAIAGDSLTFPSFPYRANAEIVREIINPRALILQLDVRLVLEDGRTLIESTAGWGTEVNAAVRLALEQFSSGTFHVLLAALFGCRCEGYADQEERLIGGRLRHVTTGNLTTAGQVPESAPGQADLRWVASVREFLSTKSLGSGTHWLRIYYCHSQGTALECEVLLDNHPWPELHAEVAALDWPRSDGYYSFRWFQVIQDAESALPVRPGPCH